MKYLHKIFIYSLKIIHYHFLRLFFDFSHLIVSTSREAISDIRMKLESAL